MHIFSHDGRLANGSSDGSVQRPNATERHERATVQLEFSCLGTLSVRVSTRSRFLRAPEVSLQLDPSTQTTTTDGALSRHGDVFVATFNVRENNVEGIVSVRGVTHSGRPTSAVQAFSAAQLTEEGEYRVFGPQGSLALDCEISNCEPALLVCICEASTETSHELEKRSLTQSFAIRFNKALQRPVELMIPIRVAERTHSARAISAEMHRWDEVKEAWSIYKDTKKTHMSGRIIQVRVSRSGVFRVIETPKELPPNVILDNEDLRRTIVSQARMITQSIQLHVENAEVLSNLLLQTQWSPEEFESLKRFHDSLGLFISDSATAADAVRDRTVGSPFRFEEW